MFIPFLPFSLVFSSLLISLFRHLVLELCGPEVDLGPEHGPLLWRHVVLSQLRAEQGADEHVFAGSGAVRLGAAVVLILPAELFV